jgi:hypothetical protein
MILVRDWVNIVKLGKLDRGAMNYSDTYCLFGDDELRETMGPDKKCLEIVVGRNKTLSKNQITFNRLTKRIEQLQGIIQTETAKLESLLKIYLAEILEQKLALAESRVMVAKALGASTKKIKFGKRQYEDVRTVILDLCEEAFVEIEPDKETEAFYDAWAETSYRDEARSQTDAMKREIADHARAALDIDIDLDDIEDTPEGFARFARRLQNEFEEKEQAGQHSRQKKSKKQLEREGLRKQEEAQTLKSMRNIYLSLAKALHPDTITDPEEKNRKEELMKKVTAAYSDRDLSMLLKLEMEWVRTEGHALDTLPDDQLKLYIASLKEQVEALEQERDVLYMNPRFADVSEFAGFPESSAKQQIKKAAQDYQRAIKGLKDLMTVFSKTAPKKEIVSFVKSYIAVTVPRYFSPEEFIENNFF